MSDFLEIVFPENLARLFEGGPLYRTYVSRADSAYEQRIQAWSDPIYEYSIDLLMMTDPEFRSLLNFFHIVKGRKYGFRFKDYCDYQVSNQALGTVSSTPATLQSVKSYEVETHSWNRTIHKLIEGTVTVYVDGVDKTSNCTINYNTGEITVNDVGTVTYDAEFHVPCRFDTDALRSRIDRRKIPVSNIVIRSIRP